MANPDELDFDEFVLSMMDVTFSSAIDNTVLSSDFEDNLLHNVSNEEQRSEEGNVGEEEENIQSRPSLWKNVTTIDPGPPKTIPIYM